MVSACQPQAREPWRRNHMCRGRCSWGDTCVHSWEGPMTEPTSPDCTWVCSDCSIMQHNAIYLNVPESLPLWSLFSSGVGGRQ